MVAQYAELQFEVEDTGIGIPQEKQDRLFHAFSQVDSSPTRRYDGTGLGLVISRRLCELMGGRMWVESQPHRGSTFYFTIRVKVPPDQHHHHHSEPLDDPPQPNPDRHRASTHPHASTSSSSSPSTSSSTSSSLSSISYDATPTRQTRPGESSRLSTFPPFPMPPTRLKRYSHSFPARLRPIAPCATNEGPGTGPGGAPSLQSIRRHSYVVNDGSLSPTDMRVLLVEDNLVNQKVALKLLGRLGYSNVRVANDGRQAVDIIAASASATGQAGCDVVIMDLHMPEMDGITASRIIKRTARSAGSAAPYIIACTADLQYDTRQACVQAGLDGYLEKPIKLKDLSRAMMEAHAAVYP